jgi:glycosyltransferase involved in cell wall biosynthesis
MPRALHILGSLNPGGVERWLRDSVRRRGESAWGFDFCLLGEGRGAYAPELEALGCRVLACPLTPRATFAARLFSLLRRERYDVVHSHVHHFSGLVLAVAYAAAVPVRVAHSHTCEPAGGPVARRLYRRGMQALLERSMTAGFACSEQAAGFAGAAVRSRLEILACGIDLEAFRNPRPYRARLRRQLGVPGDALVVGSVGRLAPEKNQAFLLRVAARLANELPRLRVAIVGGGSRAALEDLARRLGLEGRVVFTGPRDDVPELLGGAFDAFALPSLREGLPAVVLEAQAAGLPCVVSDQTPAEAIVTPGNVERIGLHQGIETWAAALARALGRPRWDGDDACQRLRQRGFDVSTSFRALTGTYQEMLDAASATTGFVASSGASSAAKKSAAAKAGRAGGWPGIGQAPRN